MPVVEQTHPSAAAVADEHNRSATGALAIGLLLSLAAGAIYAPWWSLPVYAMTGRTGWYVFGVLTCLVVVWLWMGMATSGHIYQQRERAYAAVLGCALAFAAGWFFSFLPNMVESHNAFLSTPAARACAWNPRSATCAKLQQVAGTAKLSYHDFLSARTYLAQHGYTTGALYGAQAVRQVVALERFYTDRPLLTRVVANGVWTSDTRAAWVRDATRSGVPAAALADAQ